MKASIVLAALIATGCAVTPSTQVIKQVETSAMQTHAFCQGGQLKSYIETDYYYQFTCGDGRFFMLPK